MGSMKSRVPFETFDLPPGLARAFMPLFCIPQLWRGLRARARRAALPTWVKRPFPLFVAHVLPQADNGNNSPS
jgi:hypothetical protein